MPEIINKHCDKYNGDADVRVVVLHHTAGSEQGDLATLWGTAEVSIHAYITKAGTIYLGVPLGKRAWHAGSPTYWNGLTDINSYSIGVELENWGNDVDPFPPAQLAALDYFLAAIVRPQYGNLPITRHRDILAEKHDPADNFPWDLYSGGIAQVMQRSGIPGSQISGGKDMYELEIPAARGKHPNGWEQFRCLYDGALEHAWILVGYSQYDDAQPLDGGVSLLDHSGNVIWHQDFQLKDKSDFAEIELPAGKAGRVAVDYVRPGIGDIPIKRGVLR